MKKSKREYGPDLHIRLPVEVRAVLEIKARKNNQNMTEYLTNLILARPVQYPEIVQRMDMIIDQVRRIGININQIARHENAGIFDSEDIRNLKVFQAQMEESVLELRKSLMNPKV